MFFLYANKFPFRHSSPVAPTVSNLLTQAKIFSVVFFLSFTIPSDSLLINYCWIKHRRREKNPLVFPVDFPVQLHLFLISSTMTTKTRSSTSDTHPHPELSVWLGSVSFSSIVCSLSRRKQSLPFRLLFGALKIHSGWIECRYT